MVVVVVIIIVVIVIVGPLSPGLVVVVITGLSVALTELEGLTGGMFLTQFDCLTGAVADHCRHRLPPAGGRALLTEQGSPGSENISEST